MVTFDDIATAVVARCNASSAFNTAVPGKAWLDRADENAAGAYAVFGIERAGEPEFDSGGGYTQEFTLRMAVYTDVGPTDPPADPPPPDPQAAQLAMAAALNTNPTSWTALRDGRVMHCLPRGYDGKYDPRLRNARDVFVSGGQWSMLIEGNLGA